MLATNILKISNHFSESAVYNFFSSLAKGKKADKNLWSANTLEWIADSPPPHGNFKEFPVVYRGPYDYSLPGIEEDFIPQNVPVSEKEKLNRV